MMPGSKIRNQRAAKAEAPAETNTHTAAATNAPDSMRLELERGRAAVAHPIGHSLAEAEC